MKLHTTVGKCSVLSFVCDSGADIKDYVFYTFSKDNFFYPIFMSVIDIVTLLHPLAMKLAPNFVT